METRAIAPGGAAPGGGDAYELSPNVRAPGKVGHIRAVYVTHASPRFAMHAGRCRPEVLDEFAAVVRLAQALVAPHETLLYVCEVELKEHVRGRGVGADLVRRFLAGLQRRFDYLLLWPCPYAVSNLEERIEGARRLWGHWQRELGVRPVGDAALGSAFLGRRVPFPYLDAAVVEPVQPYVVPLAWARAFRSNKWDEFTARGLVAPPGFVPRPNAPSGAKRARTTSPVLGDSVSSEQQDQRNEIREVVLRNWARLECD